jgi:hypothetical protein
MSRGAAFLVGGLLLAVSLAVLSPLASKNPDGLEHVTETSGISPVTSIDQPAPMPDYWDDRGPLRKIAAGVAGTLLVFGLTYGLGHALRKKKAGSGGSSGS